MVASDWSGSANQANYAPCDIQQLSRNIAQALEQQGAGKKKSKSTKEPKPTSERVTVGCQKKIVYEGPKGGKYIKQNGGYQSLSDLFKRSK